MAETEQVNKAPKCDWRIRIPNSDPVPAGSEPPTQPCGSEDRLYRVSKPSRDDWGNSPREERNICQRHLGDAWNDPSVDSAVPIDLPGR